LGLSDEYCRRFPRGLSAVLRVSLVVLHRVQRHYTLYYAQLKALPIASSTHYYLYIARIAAAS